ELGQGRESGRVLFGSEGPARTRRCQRDGTLGQLRRRLRGAARPRVGRRRIECRRYLLIGPGGGDREMSGALLEIEVQRGEAAVKIGRASCRARGWGSG